jgi:hypothetical protein
LLSGYSLKGDTLVIRADGRAPASDLEVRATDVPLLEIEAARRRRVFGISTRQLLKGHRAN